MQPRTQFFSLAVFAVTQERGAHRRVMGAGMVGSVAARAASEQGDPSGNAHGHG